MTIRATDEQRRQSIRPTRIPLDLNTAKVPRGLVFVIPERCKGCEFCIAFCPTQTLEFSEEINAKGYHFPTVAKGKESACTDCKFCDLVCPELAIYTRDANGPMEESGDEPPNHDD